MTRQIAQALITAIRRCDGIIECSGLNVPPQRESIRPFFRAPVMSPEYNRSPRSSSSEIISGVVVQRPSTPARSDRAPRRRSVGPVQPTSSSSVSDGPTGFDRQRLGERLSCVLPPPEFAATRTSAMAASFAGSRLSLMESPRS